MLVGESESTRTYQPIGRAEHVTCVYCGDVCLVINLKAYRFLKALNLILIYLKGIRDSV